MMCSANLLAKFLCILIILTCLNFLSSSDRIRIFLWQVLATLNKKMAVSWNGAGNMAKFAKSQPPKAKKKCDIE